MYILESTAMEASRRSLRRIADTRDDLPLHNATLQELLSDIMKHKDAWAFLRPVMRYEVNINKSVFSLRSIYGVVTSVVCVDS